jgi:hypothetical protein
MRTFLFLFLTFQYFNTEAQNYKLIDPLRENHFKYKVFYENRISTIKTDSFAVSGCDTVFYNYKLFDFENLWSSCIDINKPNFFIDRMLVSSNGDYRIFNINNDTILIKSRSALSDQWILYRFPNGNYIEATVS